VIKPSRSRLSGIAIAKGLLVGLALTACHPKPMQQPTPPPDPAAADDAKLIERMEKMHARALAAPGGTSEASDFAAHVAMLFTQGVSARHPVAPTLIDEAVECLARAKEAHPDDAADLLVRKGELLLAADRKEAGVDALRESIAIRPALRAFTPLAKFYAAEKRSADLTALCKRTLPGMKSDESRYAVLDDCFKSSGAATPEAGLAWAPAKEVSFYKARRRDLEARLEAAKRQRAKEDESAKH